jgi:hypothetical protein
VDATASERRHLVGVSFKLRLRINCSRHDIRTGKVRPCVQVTTGERRFPYCCCEILCHKAICCSANAGFLLADPFCQDRGPAYLSSSTGFELRFNWPGRQQCDCRPGGLDKQIDSRSGRMSPRSAGATTAPPSLRKSDRRWSTDAFARWFRTSCPRTNEQLGCFSCASEPAQLYACCSCGSLPFLSQVACGWLRLGWCNRSTAGGLLLCREQNSFANDNPKGVLRESYIGGSHGFSRAD